jgi:hypothetical protein
MDFKDRVKAYMYRPGAPIDYSGFIKCKVCGKKKRGAHAFGIRSKTICQECEDEKKLKKRYQRLPSWK